MIIAVIILYTVFFLLCFLGTGSDEKNIKSFYSYPDRVQEMVREKHKIPKKKSYGLVFLSNAVIFTVVFVVIGLLTGSRSFWYYLFLGEGLNVFDLVVIDLLWWQHSRRIRFKGIGKERDYHGAKKHVAAFLRAIPVFAVAAGLAAVIMQLI